MEGKLSCFCSCLAMRMDERMHQCGASEFSDVDCLSMTYSMTGNRWMARADKINASCLLMLHYRLVP